MDKLNVQRRGEAVSVATPNWAACAFAPIGDSEGRNRPLRRWVGPYNASHVARRAASRSAWSLGEGCSLFVLVDKSETSVVAEPMIPLVHRGRIDLPKKRNASVKPSSHVAIGHRMPSCSDAPGHSFNREVFRRQLDEMEAHAKAKAVPAPDSPRIHHRPSCAIEPSHGIPAGVQKARPSGCDGGCQA